MPSNDTAEKYNIPRQLYTGPQVLPVGQYARGPTKRWELSMEIIGNCRGSSMHQKRCSFRERIKEKTRSRIVWCEY